MVHPPIQYRRGHVTRQSVESEWLVTVAARKDCGQCTNRVHGACCRQALRTPVSDTSHAAVSVCVGKLAVGIEPTTARLQIGCSTAELRQHAHTLRQQRWAPGEVRFTPRRQSRICTPAAKEPIGRGLSRTVTRRRLFGRAGGRNRVTPCEFVPIRGPYIAWAGGVLRRPERGQGIGASDELDPRHQRRTAAAGRRRGTAPPPAGGGTAAAGGIGARGRGRRPAHTYRTAGRLALLPARPRPS